jgi:hypothetical protein
MNSRGREGIGGSNVALRASPCVDVRFGNAPILKLQGFMQTSKQTPKEFAENPFNAILSPHFDIRLEIKRYYTYRNRKEKKLSGMCESLGIET